MLVKTFCSAVYGIEASIITVEVNITAGLHSYIVGLPDNAVKESLRRIESAIAAIGLRMPRQKIVINLAPADIRKEGSSYDLSIAIGILSSSRQIEPDIIGEYILLGELSLDGTIQSVKGVLPIAVQAKKEGYKGIVLPRTNAREAAVVSGLHIVGVDRLEQVVAFFRDQSTIEST
ncbi:magnesium chelatase, partial [Parapusillimonas sp. SGNA-6]|nr:magnesium chelatase [Parapusillimonas sp. SGNA-6]